MEKVLVIKINMVPSSKEGLEERTRKSWKVCPKRLDDVKHIIEAQHALLVLLPNGTPKYLL